MLHKRWNIGRQPHPRNTKGRVASIGVEHYHKLELRRQPQVRAR